MRLESEVHKAWQIFVRNTGSMKLLNCIEKKNMKTNTTFSHIFKCFLSFYIKMDKILFLMYYKSLTVLNGYSITCTPNLN